MHCSTHTRSTTALGTRISCPIAAAAGWQAWGGADGGRGRAAVACEVWEGELLPACIIDTYRDAPLPRLSCAAPPRLGPEPQHALAPPSCRRLPDSPAPPAAISAPRTRVNSWQANLSPDHYGVPAAGKRHLTDADAPGGGGRDPPLGLGGVLHHRLHRGGLRVDALRPRQGTRTSGPISKPANPRASSRARSQTARCLAASE